MGGHFYMIKKTLVIMFLLIPSICFAQTNKKLSELTDLGGSPSNADVLPITHSGTTYKVTFQDFVSGIGGTGLGANLSSTGYSILSNTGTVGFGDDNLVTTGTMTASHFVATSSDPTVITSLDVTGSMIIPVLQNCPAAENGQVCIDTNIGGLPSSIAFMGAELTKQVVISVPIANFLAASDAQVISYDAVNDYMKFVDVAIDAWDGTPGTLIYPKTPTTTDFAIGSSSKTTADHVLNTDGSAEFNKQKASADIVFSGDNETNLLFLDGSTDRIGIGTNNPQSPLEIVGTLTVSGTGTSYVKFPTAASADPCTNSGTGELANGSMFRTTAEAICFCDSSGDDLLSTGLAPCTY